MERAATETDAARGERCVPQPTVGSTLVRIHEDIVRFAQFLELFLGVRVLRIFIWMKLNREFAIRALDLLFGGASSNAQHVVVIAFVRGGHMATSLCD